MAWGYPSWGGSSTRPDTTRTKKKKGPKKTGLGSTGFGHDTGSGLGTNRNKGNKRFGEVFRTEQAKGGEFHIYDGGKRVFVPGKTAKKGKPMRGRSEAVSMIVDAMRGAPIKGKGGLPKPGDKGRRTLPGSPIAPRQKIGTVNNPTEVLGGKSYGSDTKRTLDRARARKLRDQQRRARKLGKVERTTKR